MTEGRLKEIAIGFLRRESMDMEADLLKVLRFTLAERDREVAEWAEAHADVIPAEDSLERGVELGPLLSFLEAQP